jgi:hypothetical protein
MNKFRDTIITCWVCMSKTEVTTDWRTSKLVERTLKACACPVADGHVSSKFDVPMTGVCEVCGEACRSISKRCVPCSNASDYDKARSSAEYVATSFPKCACGVILTHRLGRTCRACKIARNRDYQNARNAERREQP